MRKALVDFTSILMIILSALIAVLTLYFAFQQLGEVSKEIGKIAAERVIVAQGGDCKISIVRQV